MNQRLEAERDENRERIGAMEQRINEMSELMNLELEKGYENDKEK